MDIEAFLPFKSIIISLIETFCSRIETGLNRIYLILSQIQP